MARMKELRWPLNRAPPPHRCGCCAARDRPWLPLCVAGALLLAAAGGFLLWRLLLATTTVVRARPDLSSSCFHCLFIYKNKNSSATVVLLSGADSFRSLPVTDFLCNTDPTLPPHVSVVQVVTNACSTTVHVGALGAAGYHTPKGGGCAALPALRCACHCPLPSAALRLRLTSIFPAGQGDHRCARGRAQ